jgi:hypothetical protein
LIIRHNFLTVNSKDERVVFTDSAGWRGKQSPSAKYQLEKPLEIVKPKVFATKIHKPLSKDSWQIPKMDGPGPGSYETTKAITETQWGNVTGFTKQMEKNMSYTDKIKLAKKWVPGAGTYKNIDNYATKLHKDKDFRRTYVR